MSDTLTIEQERYWIKAGMLVKLRGMDLQVMVDSLVYKTFTLPDGTGGQRSEKRLFGVQCHWVDKEHKYQKGMFHTRELEKIDS